MRATLFPSLQAEMISMAAVGAMLWSKKSKPAGLLSGMRLLLVLHVAVETITRWRGVKGEEGRTGPAGAGLCG
jgi:hypothetical protein